MSFRSVTFYNFRNIRNGTVRFPSREIFLVGNNGQGKTNILESLYILSYGSSFKRKSEQVFKKYGTDSCSLTGKFNIEEDEDNEIRFKEEKNRQILLNGNPLKDRKEMIRLNPVVLFSHEDFHIITGEPDLRRKYIDQIICFYHCEYIDLKRRYKLILNQRNTLLKEKNYPLLDIYDRQLSQTAFSVFRFREEQVKKINGMFSEIYKDITGQRKDIELVYRSSLKGKTEEEQLKEIRGARNDDIRFLTTSKGPHRDNFVFVSEKKDFSKTASTGQKRILSLILKLIQTEFLKEAGIRPILLLDDVILEVDGEKRKRFLKRLNFYDQIFFTFLPEENYSDYMKKETTVLFVEGGEISERSSVF